MNKRVLIATGAIATLIAAGVIVGVPERQTECTGVTIRPGQEAQRVVAKHPAGTTFCFAAGLHRIRETIEPKAGSTLLSTAGAVLTGSVRLADWTAAGRHWTTRGALPPTYERTGQCEDNHANICHLREQVFVDGKHLRRVASAGQVKAGTFYADYQADVIHLGDDPRGRAVEMSSTATAIESKAAGITIRGLTVEHFASAPQHGAITAGRGWRLVDNDVRWNHAVGVFLRHAHGAVVERNNLHHNGQLGLGQHRSTGVRIADNEVVGNNTDGFWIADWESGGIKSTWSTGGSVTGNRIRDNLGIGLWSDLYDDGRRLAGNRIEDNAADGIRFEISRNAVIERNVVTGNGFGTGRGSGPTLWDGAGINVNTSSKVTVRQNTIRDNVNGITLQSRKRQDGPWGPNLLRDVVVTGNNISMTRDEQGTGIVQNAGAELPAGEVRLSHNHYRLDRLDATRFQRFGTRLTARGWQRAGYDTGSTFTTG